MNSSRIRYISRLGENYFERLCIESNLSASPPKHDENGWDAIVEFPLNALLGRHRDGQPAPMKCLVQVKATDQMAGSAIDMSVSNWEKLALSIIPTFVAIFYIEGKNEVQSLTLSHFDSSCVVKTLQKVRALEDSGELDVINHRVMSFTPRGEDFIDFSEMTILQRTIHRLIGHDFGAYAEQKARTLREIGFDHRSHTLRFSTESTISDIVDAFLGLTEFEVKDVRLGSIRFGIELEDHSFTSGSIRITPQPAGNCKIIASSKSRKIRANLDAQIFIPQIPGLDIGRHKKLVIAGDVRLEFAGDGGTFSVDFSENRTCTLDDIFREAQFLSAVAAKDARMQLQIEDKVFPLNLSDKVVKGDFFAILYQSASIVRDAVAKTAVAGPIWLRVHDLTNQSASVRWFACVSQKVELTLTSKLMAVQLPERIPKAGYFATSIWMRFHDQSLVLFCLWKSAICRNGSDLVFKLRECRIFEAFWAVDPTRAIPPVWPRFRDYCRDEAGSAPLMIFGPPEEIGSEHSEATFHIG